MLMSEFDKKAATWDEDPTKIERATTIASKLKDYFKDEIFNEALDYGSGTGLLGFAFLERCNHLTLMDESIEMTNLAKQKALKFEKGRVEAVQIDLMNDVLPEKRFDIIFTLLTMHHIPNTDGILEKFYDVLNPGGILAIIDLEKEDGSFHDGDFDGHLGFNKANLEDHLKNNGLKAQDYMEIYRITKKLENGVERDYPLFLSISKKPNE